MPVYNVYYQKSEYKHNGLREFEVEQERKNPIAISQLAERYALMFPVQVPKLYAVYNRMQFRNWTAAEKLLPMPEGVSHKSMIAGDIIRLPSGVYLECLLLGWRMMS